MLNTAYMHPCATYYGKTIAVAERMECFPAYRYCVKSKIKISDIKFTVLQQKKVSKFDVRSECTQMA